MKIHSFLAVLAVGQAGKKEKTRDPEKHLRHIVRQTTSLLGEMAPYLRKHEDWEAKFKRNADNLLATYKRTRHRCDLIQERNGAKEGNRRRRREVARPFFESVLSVEKTNRYDISLAIKQVTTRFRRWADAHVAACRGNKKHKRQQQKMAKWRKKLTKHWNEHKAALQSL
ncbi:Oidioi.mRNA.OKI2018_I69.XSR.g15858.t1.cds [Oikopleura dioica]|uniref:Oidioi.mRNA.OKI2018_I69.XSR.g15858.t1.cds n=1 Tax=Oikopleura dioica TaxID=34765 RepID=A0ABN7SJB1_OIKDI|nr:Oidioi.mRNA.OKI2018_I69.XSR.g15858.t1.cds [Oikopleura dioica]